MQVVNGFVCRNCTDVDLAKKSIDPAHPKLADGRPATPQAKKAEKESVEKKHVLATQGTVGTKLDVSA